MCCVLWLLLWLCARRGLCVLGCVAWLPLLCVYPAPLTVLHCGAVASHGWGPCRRRAGRRYVCGATRGTVSGGRVDLGSWVLPGFPSGASCGDRARWGFHEDAHGVVVAVLLFVPCCVCDAKVALASVELCLTEEAFGSFAEVVECLF